MLHDTYQIIGIAVIAALVAGAFTVLMVRSWRENFNRIAHQEEDRHECQLLRDCNVDEAGIKIMLEAEGRTYYPPEEE